jgi:hypothetical protein
VAWLVAAVVAVAVFLFMAWRIDGTRLPFWAIETATTAVMVAVVVFAGPAIRRYGERFEAAVFHGNESAGTHVLRLLDIAYYLVFSAYTIMTLRFAPPVSWASMGRIINEELDRLGGLLLMMGLLHVLLVLALPVVGLIFTANERRMVRAARGAPRRGADLVVERVDIAITIASWVFGGVAALWAVSLAIQLVLGGLG